jgi:hypothetical protein
VLVTATSRVSRPALITSGAALRTYSPGIIEAP